MKIKLFMVDGVKYYPVCGWYKNQHKFDYWATKTFNEAYDHDWAGEYAARHAKAQKWLEYAFAPKDGLIWAPYEDYVEMKEAIVAYDLCH